LFGTTASQSVIDPQFAPQNGERRVSFLDLIQTLAIREIRLQEEVPLPKFRQAIQFAKERFNLDYPFARQHCTYLLGKELVIRPPGTEDEFIEASGKHRGQRLFAFVEMYLRDLTFGVSGLAEEYRIFESHHPEPIAIRMNPQRRFGEPLLPSGYTPLAIWESIKVEGGIDRTAKVYGIPTEEVETAYKFVVDHLGKTA